MRLRAIWCCLWYSVRPWWMYEARCHYRGMSYLAHLCLNLQLAWRWARGRQSFGDIRFEVTVNGGGRRRTTQRKGLQ